MYVCLCKGVTDREIRAAVELGARSFDDVRATLGVATCCRKCTECASALVAKSVAGRCAAAGGDD
jgi:bacterioferritin-associated ferredoxin